MQALGVVPLTPLLHLEEIVSTHPVKKDPLFELRSDDSPSRCGEAQVFACDECGPVTTAAPRQEARCLGPTLAPGSTADRRPEGRRGLAHLLDLHMEPSTGRAALSLPQHPLKPQQAGGAGEQHTKARVGIPLLTVLIRKTGLGEEATRSMFVEHQPCALLLQLRNLL
ncbi:hypothetical protein P7K49_009182 [Saguinus oedipus]|uniref:Uncharacterized protein n=1 Tax=Saguinus oedipus TaxID=9490 RepID=A0ABQ9VJ77_SAGOE|nr:hypothetical protein P7K49_009182 [Saguinus oedipus]